MSEPLKMNRRERSETGFASAKSGVMRKTVRASRSRLADIAREAKVIGGGSY